MGGSKGGRMKCFRIDRGPCMRGEVTTQSRYSDPVGGAILEWSEAMRARRHGPHPRHRSHGKNHSGVAGGQSKVFWFFGPVKDFGKTRAACDAATLRSSLQIRYFLLYTVCTDTI
jgi:hypothetical protein